MSQIDIRIPFSNTAGILPETHIQLPVKSILNAPVSSDGVGVFLDWEDPAHDVVLHLLRGLAVTNRFAADQSYSFQTRPL